MEKIFSLIFGYRTENAEEIVIPLVSEYNPYEEAKRRVAIQKMLAGVNVQDSGFLHQDGKITVAGKILKRDAFDALWAKYTDPVDAAEPFVFVSYLTNPSEKWRVVWFDFSPVPTNQAPNYYCSWTMAFQILGKLDPTTGELIP